MSGQKRAWRRLLEKRHGQVVGGTGAHAVDGHQGRGVLGAAARLFCLGSLLGCDALAGFGEGFGNVGTPRMDVLECRAGDRDAGQGVACCLHGVLRLRAKEKPAQWRASGLVKSLVPGHA